MIFQNPLDSLNPVYTIGSQISEGLIAEGKSKEEAHEIAFKTLKDVKISDVQSRMKSYPHEISGGMRQRVMIAMMLCRNPKLLIACLLYTSLLNLVFKSFRAVLHQNQLQKCGGCLKSETAFFSPKRRKTNIFRRF